MSVTSTRGSQALVPHLTGRDEVACPRSRDWGGGTAHAPRLGLLTPNPVVLQPYPALSIPVGMTAAHSGTNLGPSACSIPSLELLKTTLVLASGS